MRQRSQHFPGVRRLVTALLLGVVLTGSATNAIASQVLITAQEAALPTPPGSTAISQRGVTRGPKITLLSPASAGLSPLDFKLKFESFGGAKIDVGSLHITYLKTPAVDLTDRVKPYIQPTGLEMPQAEVPPGDHVIKVEVADSDGRIATNTFVLKITQDTGSNARP